MVQQIATCADVDVNDTESYDNGNKVVPSYLLDPTVITADNIVLGNEVLMNGRTDKEMTLREYNIRIVKNYLEKYDNDIKSVAQRLDIGVATIYRMLKEEK